MYYKVRIDADKHTYSQIEEFISSFTTTYVGCYEENKDGSNPHTHWYVESILKNQTIRKRIRNFAGKGNGNYSLGKADEQLPQEYLRYIVKDRNICYHPNFDKEIIEKAIKQDEKLKADIKEKRKSKKKVLEKIEEYVLEVHPQDRDLTRYDVLKHVLTYYKKENKLVRKFAIISQVQTICLKHVQGYQDYLQDSWSSDI